jgi:hypothetical protein
MILGQVKLELPELPELLDLHPLTQTLRIRKLEAEDKLETLLQQELLQELILVLVVLVVQVVQVVAS